MKRLLAFLLGAILVATTAAAQESPVRLRVHPDCTDCFPDYLRDEIRWVDFVRQPQDADVQILSSSRETGGGGIEVTLRFVGLGRFAGTEHELRAVTPPGETEDVRRRGVLRVVSVGLLTFMARDGLPAGLSLDVASDDEEASRQATRDPWNFWVFTVGADFQHDAEETTRESSWEVRSHSRSRDGPLEDQLWDERAGGA